jgi:hypothetical protein
VLLLSHICNFTSSRLRALRRIGDTQHLLVNHVAHWLVSGGSLASRLSACPKGRSAFWMPLARPVTPGRVGESIEAKLRMVWRFIQWAGVGIVLTFLTLASLQQIVFPSLSWLIMRLNIQVGSKEAGRSGGTFGAGEDSGSFLRRRGDPCSPILVLDPISSLISRRFRRSAAECCDGMCHNACLGWARTAR